ncbi:MAG: tetratricopeptide repeat protein [Alphaproteobacteria bacterium]|nr:tetratricopeptide repeat protein [Alphaproteobacteria bacterium]
MTPPDFARIREALLQARALDGAARAAWLDALATRDPALHDAVASLLAHDDAPSPILDGGLHPEGPGALLAAAWAEQDAHVPDRIGPYAITGVIGQGGMGVVYRARQTEPLERDVALKVLRVGLDAPRARARFEAEAHALARLHHPHVAQVFDAGVDAGGRPYLVMELVDGVPLTSWVLAHAAPLSTRLDLFGQVLQAVRHAHQRGLIHRDLKPSNLLVTLDAGAPQAKVIDFGIAKVAEPAPGDPTLTLVDQVVGTPAYMSPEQAGAFGGEVDTRTDVWALGVVLYELLCGQRPFELTDTLPEHIRATLTGAAPRPPSRVAPPDGPVRPRDLAGDLDTIVLHALRPEPDRRYPSVDALADDLHRHAVGEAVRARGDAWRYRTGRFLRRHWQAVTVAAGVAATLAGSTAVLAVQADHLREERNRAVQAEAQARREAATATGVTDFLVSLFDLADPNDTRGHDITAREVLDMGVQRIHDEPPDDPRVTARLLLALGDTYLSLRDFEHARPLVTEAVTLREEALGPDAPEVAEALSVLAVMEHDEGELEASLEHQRRAIAILERQATPDPAALAENWNGLGVTLDALGNYPEAEAAYRTTIALQETALGDEDPELAWSVMTLGQVRYRRGAWVEARGLFEDALARLQRLEDPPPFDLGSVLNNLGGARLSLDDVPGAVAAFEQALATFRDTFGEEHPAVGRGLHNLSRALLAAGRVDEAAQASEAGVRVLEATLGPDHTLTAGAILQRGEVQLAQGALDDAALDIDRAARALGDNLGADHPAALAAERQQARLAAMRGDATRAQALHTHILDAIVGSVEADSPALARARLDLAVDHLAAGDAAGAGALVDAARAGLAQLPPSHTFTRLADGIAAAVRGDAAAKEAAAEALATRLGANDPWVTALRGGR